MTFYEIEMESRKLREKIKCAKPQLDIKGTAYYVSLDGDDNNDGLTPDTAWKTTERVNSHRDSFAAGDAVLFRCGDVFRGDIWLKSDMTYSSFGVGAKPELWASPFNAAKKDWEKVAENIYSLPFPLKKDIGIIVFNHGEEWGYKKFELDPNESLDLDFFHDVEQGVLYLCSEKGNPKERWNDIEIGPRITIMHGVCPNNCTVDGLTLKYTGSHGIGLSSLNYTTGGPPRHDNIYNFTVRNCEFEWIGGSDSGNRIRYGNGFEIWGGCDGLLIENSYFNQIYDAAITQQYQGSFAQENVLHIENAVMRNNLIENSIYSYEYFLSEYFPGTREKKLDTLSTIKNVLFDSNICRLCGYGFGNQRPDRHSPTHIKSWGHHNKSENFVISNNIFDRADYCLVEIMAGAGQEYIPTLKGNIYCQYENKEWIRAIKGQKATVFNRETIKNPTENFAEADAVTVKPLR